MVQNLANDFFEPALLTTLRTLKRTVLLSGRHSPTVTVSPILTSLKQEHTYFRFRGTMGYGRINATALQTSRYGYITATLDSKGRHISRASPEPPKMTHFVRSQKPQINFPQTCRRQERGGSCPKDVKWRLCTDFTDVCRVFCLGGSGRGWAGAITRG